MVLSMLELVYNPDFLLSGFAFLSTILITPIVISQLKKRGLVGLDLHKNIRKEIPNIGGIAIAAAFTLSIVLAFIFYQRIVYLIVLMSFLLSASLGLVDDRVHIKPLEKLLLSGVAVIPLFLFTPLKIIPIIFIFGMGMIISNWTNMLAGFNGLETGLGLIGTVVLALATPPGIASTILWIYAACLLGFLLFNRYPAKVFPGDVGTLPIGIVWTAAYVLGAPLLVLIIILLPYFVDALLKLLSAGFMNSADHAPTTVRNGFLTVKKGGYVSLSKLILRIRPLKEWQLVLILWNIELILGILALIII